MSESTAIEKTERDIEQDKFDTMILQMVMGGFAWLFLVSIPLMLVFDPESAWVRGGIMLAYIPLCRWLYFSKSGPGVEGVNKVFIAIVEGIVVAVTAVPERIRFWLVAPFFVAATLAMAVHIGYLALSDEVSQKRALFGSYESGRDIKWFHSGDKIDVYVFSDYMDRKFEVEEGHVGVHLTYKSSNTMSRTGYDFRQMLEADLTSAQYGKTGTTADAEMAVFGANRNPLSGVSYHGAFGATGVGVMEMIICTMALFFTLTLLYTDKKYRHSGLLTVAPVLFACFIYAGQAGSIEGDRPEKISELTVNKPESKT